MKVLGKNGGETIMKGLETGFDIVIALVKGGPAAVWGSDQGKTLQPQGHDRQRYHRFCNGHGGQEGDTQAHCHVYSRAGFISAILSI